MTHEIVRGSPRHIRPMSRRMRSTAAMTLQGYGFDPRRALHHVFRQSLFCRTALIDGKPVAMWGVVGALLGEAAYVWLVMSDDIVHLPRQIVTEARKELATMAAGYTELATTVLPADEAALRFALHLGFHDRHDGPELGRRDRVRQVLDDPRYRIPIGDSYVIGLGYHAEAA